MRSAAYGRHAYTATLSSRLAVLDEDDRRATLLIAQDKQSGECLGTLRISFSVRGLTPHDPKEDLSELEGQEFAYVDRFAVTSDSQLHTEVRAAIMKSMWLHLCEHEVPWVIASSLKALTRLYATVGMRTIRGNEAGVLIPKLHDTKPYFTVGGRVEELFDNIQRRYPESLPYFVQVWHPDLEFAWPPPYFLDPSRAPQVPWVRQLLDLPMSDERAEPSLGALPAPSSRQVLVAA